MTSGQRIVVECSAADVLLPHGVLMKKAPQIMSAGPSGPERVPGKERLCGPRLVAGSRKSYLSTGKVRICPSSGMITRSAMPRSARRFFMSAREMEAWATLSMWLMMTCAWSQARTTV